MTATSSSSNNNNNNNNNRSHHDIELSFLLRFSTGFFVIVVGLLWSCLKSIFMVSFAKSSYDNEDNNLYCNRLGGRISLLVIGWNILFAWWTSSDSNLAELYRQWKFATVLSILMITPDYFLVDILGTLDFPEDGSWKIGGAVSWYMAGMWTIPFVLILSLSTRLAALVVPQQRQQQQQQQNHDNDDDAKEEEPSTNELLCATALGTLIFGISEYSLSPLNIWHATDKLRYTLGPLALYVLPAEAILGFFVLRTYRKFRHRSLIDQISACMVVMLIYTGALAVSFLVIEGRLSRLRPR